VPPEQLHLQSFFGGYNDVYTSELCLLLQNQLQEGRGGAAALLSIICCCSQIDYEVSTQLGTTSSSIHGTGDQLQP
jgi:hypothetical protein